LKVRIRVLRVEALRAYDVVEVRLRPPRGGRCPLCGGPLEELDSLGARYCFNCKLLLP